jgi:hypothetical protein
MTPANDDKQERRAALCEKIWEALSQDPDSAQVPVRAPEGLYIRDLDTDGDDSALDELCFDSILLVTGYYVLHNPWADDGPATLAAFDLGDCFYYVTDDVYEGTVLRAAIPKAIAAEALIGEERAFAWDMFANDGYPAVFYARHMDTVWFRRLIVEGVQNWKRHEPNALSELHEHVNAEMKAGLGNCTPIALAKLWNEMVGQDQLPAGEPPGLSDNSAASMSFDSWLLAVQLHWRDTGDPIGIDTARTIRVVCRLLAANDGMAESPRP